jgi:death-on-curing protein
VHATVICESGGLKGVKNPEYLESVLGHIQNDIYYPKFLDKITHLVFSVIKLHAFNDGNKRTGIALGAYFLELNGYDFSVTHFIREMENIAVWAAKNTIDRDLLKDLIEYMIIGENYPEELKLRFVRAIMASE